MLQRYEVKRVCVNGILKAIVYDPLNGMGRGVTPNEWFFLIPLFLVPFFPYFPLQDHGVSYGPEDESVVEENITNMNAIIYGLVHDNQVSQKIFYIHRQSTKCIPFIFWFVRVPMACSYVKKWNVCTSWYFDVVASFIDVLSDLDSSFCGIDIRCYPDMWLCRQPN